ncbi:hypothetical protein FO519_003101 [Halicephalobus sp. NKZ332]|nr:hypothetical protein FO519_003101 [Halicephalobus sp. NKZ332]
MSDQRSHTNLSVIFRNASKRWHKAVQGSSPPRQLQPQKTVIEPLSVTIKRTNMNMDEQKQHVEIANLALDTCGIENEIATTIKSKLDEITGKIKIMVPIEIRR